MYEIMFPSGITMFSLLPFVMVLIGATLQMSTGVGLGLIAGPFLLFVMDAPVAIQTAILLNLLLTVIMLPNEIRAVDFPSLKKLALWSSLGIPLGCVFLVFADGAILKLSSGVVVLLTVAQLKLVKPTARSGGMNRGIFKFGGGISGVMTGALAIPGPVALWTLLSSGMEPQVTRATLRAYFIYAYSLSFSVHFLLTGVSREMLVTSLMLSPSVLCGMIIGLFVRHRLSTDLLRTLLEIVLFLMGLSLFVKGIWEI